MQSEKNRIYVVILKRHESGKWFPCVSAIACPDVSDDGYVHTETQTFAPWEQFETYADANAVANKLWDSIS